MKCKDFGIKCTDCKYCEEHIIGVIEEDAPAIHTTIGWKCNKYDKYCVGMKPKRENMILKEPEIKFKEYIGDDNVKMEIEFEDYYGNTVGEVIIERGDIYVKGHILPISKVEVADWESDNHVRLQSIKTNGGDNMDEKKKNYIKAILMAWGEDAEKLNYDEDQIFVFMEDTQKGFAYLGLEKEWKAVNEKLEKLIIERPDDWFSEIYYEVDELVDLIMRDL